MRWPVGSGSAYPHFVRAGDGDHLRGLDDNEARLITLGMDALARFCLRERTRLEHSDGIVQGEVRVRDGDELVVATVTTPAVI